MFRRYWKTEVWEMRDYVPGEDLSEVIVHDEDIPEPGGKIASDHSGSGLLYVSPAFFAAHFIEWVSEPSGFSWKPNTTAIPKR